MAVANQVNLLSSWLSMEYSVRSTVPPVLRAMPQTGSLTLRTVLLRGAN